MQNMIIGKISVSNIVFTQISFQLQYLQKLPRRSFRKSFTRNIWALEILGRPLDDPKSRRFIPNSYDTSCLQKMVVGRTLKAHCIAHIRFPPKRQQSFGMDRLNNLVVWKNFSVEVVQIFVGNIIHTKKQNASCDDIQNIVG